jgi:hypothetical protein
MDLRITADLTGAEKLLASYPEAARVARISRVTEAVLLADGIVRMKTPVGAGPVHLRDTVFHQVGMGEPVWGLVSTPAQYGLPVEMGTRPHFPPVAPIQHWVEKKLGINGKEAKAVAYLVARAIAKRGTKGAKMFTRTWDEQEAAILAILNRIPEDIVRSLKQ